MAEHLFLPTLSKTETGITPPEKGNWGNRESKIILDIANGIEITEKASKKGISSIPDIWARPLMFQSAIRQNSKHPLKQQLINEWRGLMSLLALAKYKKYDLTVCPVDLLAKQPFVKALISLSPKGIVLENNGQLYNWIDPDLKEPILVIKFKEVPIGSFSPATLIYTASDYSKLLLIKAPELKDFLIDVNGFLVPPTKETDKEEIEFIGEWLCEFKIRLGKVANTENSKAVQTVENINDLINDWLKEIRGYPFINLPPDTPIKAKGVKPSDKIDIRIGNGKSIKYFEEGKYRIYQYLLCPLIIDETFKKEEKYSEMTLDSTRNLTEYKEIVVICEKLLVTGKRIWDPYSLKDLGGDAPNALMRYFKEPCGIKIDREAIDFKTQDGKKAGIWIRPELYFLSNYILKAKDGDFICANETKLNHNAYVWPFKKEILNFFSPTEIRELLDPRIIPDGGSVKFSFSLPVSGTTLRIEKTYKLKGKQEGEGDILEVDVPVIEIFPDYNGANWRRYYIVQSHVDNFSITPFLVTPDYTETNRLSNFIVDKDNHKVRIKELKGDGTFPDGIEIINSTEEPIGLILIDKYKNWKFDDENGEPNGAAKPDGVLRNTSMEIGIDFGTSNSNVYFIKGKNAGERWCYNFPKYIRQLTSSNDSLRHETLNNSFIPTKKHKLPIPTALLNKFNTHEKPTLILDYFIFFANSYKIPENVFTNLKWEQDAQDKDLQKKTRVDNTDWFIESLLFLIFLEVCKENIEILSIGCSYPKAFSPSDRSRFGRLWKDSLRRLYSGADRIINVFDENNPDDNQKPIIRGPFLMTEGIAAGYFFANPKKFISTKEREIAEATLASGAICLDVGGATTDISIWCDKTEMALYDTSILLAGKEICEYIRSKPELWTILFSPDNGGKTALTEKKNNEDQFAATLNMILKNEEKDVFTNLSKNIKNNALQSLMKIILIEFGALAYYTALLCLKANEKSDNNSLITKIQESGINLYWGGNGAKFISWLDFGLFNTNSTCVKFLNTVFYYGLNVHDITPHENILQFASPEPKSEACGGLIVSEPSQREVLGSEFKKDSASPTGGGVIKLNTASIKGDHKSEIATDEKTSLEFVCGEKIELTDGSIFDSTQYINNKNLFVGNKTLLKNTTLYELEMFVNIINGTAVALGLLNQGSEVVLNDSIKAVIKNDILNTFKTMQTKDAAQRRIQPVFMMEVIKLMQEIEK
ncbi:MAG TPA: hypothetical protein PKN48_06135 [Bacteroidales bacterium]|nr:hypothetical protein [Bacteroidales bacterium]